MITVEDVETLLAEVLDPAAFDRWWQTPMGRFDGLTPFQAWNVCGPEAVLALVQSYQDSSFT